jgi:hypothetical protein
MYGEGLGEYLHVIKGFEKPWMRDLRVLYTRTNEDIFDRLGRPKDKVWSARGGSIYYNLSEAQERQAVGLAKDVRNGYSIKEWLENELSPHVDDDPNGVTMLEILPKQEAIRAKREGRSFVYPTYKSIFSIWDYQPKGVMLDYIVFELDNDEREALGYMKGEQVFRLVDDAMDYILYVENQVVYTDEENTLINPFGVVPTIINSDIINPMVSGNFLSFYNKVVRLADEYLRKGSIKVTSDFRNGFPKYAELADDCRQCKGIGEFDGKICDECGGYGSAPMVHVSDVKLMPWPKDKDVPFVKPSEVGHYVEPSMNYHEIAVADAVMLENIMTLTLWGVESKLKAVGTNLNGTGEQKTATEITTELKPEAARLWPISKSVERRHKFILDLVIKLQITYNYPGSAVHYGRRYMQEGPDALLEKYKLAKKEGLAVPVLDDLLIQYYEAEFVSNPLKIAVMTKLMQVEPFVHNTPTQVQSFNLSDDEYKAKLFFGDWLKAQNKAVLYSATSEELRESLMEYARGKQLAPVVKEPAIA